MVRQPEQVIHFGLEHRTQLLASWTAHPQVLLRIQNEYVDAFEYQLDDLVLLLVDVAIGLRLLHLFRRFYFRFDLFLLRPRSVLLEERLLDFLRVLNHCFENLEINFEQFDANFFIGFRSQLADLVQELRGQQSLILFAAWPLQQQVSLVNEHRSHLGMVFENPTKNHHRMQLHLPCIVAQFVDQDR